MTGRWSTLNSPAVDAPLPAVAAATVVRASDCRRDHRGPYGSPEGAAESVPERVPEGVDQH